MKKVEKKSTDYLHMSKRSRYFAPASDRKQVGRQTEKVLKKFFEKNSSKIWRFQKTTYLCTTFAQKRVTVQQKRFLKKFFEKSSSKIWRFQKNNLPLHHFRSKTSDSATEKIIRGASRKLYRFFEDIEQLSLSTLRSEFQTIPLRLELRFTYTFYTMESLILAQDER